MAKSLKKKIAWAVIAGIITSVTSYMVTKFLNREKASKKPLKRKRLLKGRSEEKLKT